MGSCQNHVFFFFFAISDGTREANTTPFDERPNQNAQHLKRHVSLSESMPAQRSEATASGPSFELGPRLVVWR